MTGNVYSPLDVTTVVDELVAGMPVTSGNCVPYLYALHNQAE